MSKRVLNGILCSITLLTGCVVYIIFRPTTFVALIFDNILTVDIARDNLSFLSCDFIKYYIPDLLWSFSLGCGLIAILNPKIKGVIYCCLVSLLYGCLWEILQYFQIVSGTFDIYDIVMYLLAAIIAVIINIKE